MTMNQTGAHTLAARARGWAKSVADIVVIVGIVTLAKTAIAEAEKESDEDFFPAAFPPIRRRRRD